ncbi:MAG TPA: ABC transporter permease [Saprospiraceae bacterium]|nr:ABC transporter permease [Lewinellaceae bacterium]HPK08943.1 ABC transporter permease [Saprospiraceae bacterium]
MKSRDTLRVGFQRPFGFYASVFYLGMVLVMAIFGNMIANDKPIISTEDGVLRFPVFNSNYQPGSKVVEHVNPIIPFSYNTIDKNVTRSLPPLSRNQDGKLHIMGTDNIGRDVFAGIIRGALIVIKIAGLSVFISFVLGSFIGMCMAYYGNESIKLGALSLFFLLSGMVSWIYWWCNYFIFSSTISGIKFGIGLLFIVFVTLFGIVVSLRVEKNKWNIPLDNLGMKIVEIIRSLPGFFFILFTLILFGQGSWFVMVFLLVFMVSPAFIRHARANTLAVIRENYIESGRAIGITDLKLILRHIFPNILGDLGIIALLAFIECVMMEAALSFLGLGLPVDEMSWGKILAESRSDIRSWWLVIFPGLCLFFLVWSLNYLVNYLRKKA